MAEIGKAGAGNETNIAGADHRHAHCRFLFAVQEATTADSGDAAPSFGFMPADVIDNRVDVVVPGAHARKCDSGTGYPFTRFIVRISSRRMPLGRWLGAAQATSTCSVCRA